MNCRRQQSRDFTPPELQPGERPGGSGSASQEDPEHHQPGGGDPEQQHHAPGQHGVPPPAPAPPPPQRRGGGGGERPGPQRVREHQGAAATSEPAQSRQPEESAEHVSRPEPGPSH